MSIRRLASIAMALLTMQLTGCTGQPSESSPDKLHAETESGTVSPTGYEDDVQAALGRCWAVDPELPPIIVELDVAVRRDGTVSSATVLDQDRYWADPPFRAAADRALRAVLNPHCQPLPFPDDLWPSWSELTLRFHPRPRPEGS